MLINFIQSYLPKEKIIKSYNARVKVYVFFDSEKLSNLFVKHRPTQIGKSIFVETTHLYIFDIRRSISLYSIGILIASPVLAYIITKLLGNNDMQLYNYYLFMLIIVSLINLIIFQFKNNIITINKSWIEKETKNNNSIILEGTAPNLNYELNLLSHLTEDNYKKVPLSEKIKFGFYSAKLRKAFQNTGPRLRFKIEYKNS